MIETYVREKEAREREERGGGGRPDLAMERNRSPPRLASGGDAGLGTSECYRWLVALRSCCSPSARAPPTSACRTPTPSATTSSSASWWRSSSPSSAIRPRPPPPPPLDWEGLGTCYTQARGLVLCKLRPGDVEEGRGRGSAASYQGRRAPSPRRAGGTWRRWSWRRRRPRSWGGGSPPPPCAQGQQDGLKDSRAPWRVAAAVAGAVPVADWLGGDGQPRGGYCYRVYV